MALDLDAVLAPTDDPAELARRNTALAAELGDARELLAAYRFALGDVERSARQAAVAAAAAAELANQVRTNQQEVSG